MMDVNARLRAVREVAGFTTTDMALWFGVKRTTMSHWLGGRARPYPAIANQLGAPLDLLERACVKLKKLLPVPLSVGLYERKAYIEEIKSYAVKNFSRPDSSVKRNAVLRKNKK